MDSKKITYIKETEYTKWCKEKESSAVKYLIFILVVGAILIYGGVR